MASESAGELETAAQERGWESVPRGWLCPRHVDAKSSERQSPARTDVGELGYRSLFADPLWTMVSRSSAPCLSTSAPNSVLAAITFGISFSRVHR